MKSLALSLLLALALLPAAADAQKAFGGVTYNFSFSAVDLQEYVSADSWYGATVDLRNQFTDNPNISFGLSSGWYVFYNNVDRLIEIPNGAVSGLQYRNFNIVPILGSVHYYLGKEGGARPYAGINVGAYYARQELAIGLYSFTESNWHFGFAPEIGFAYPFQYESVIYGNVRYHYLLEAGEYLGDRSLTLGFLSLAIGMAWQY